MNIVATGARTPVGLRSAAAAAAVRAGVSSVTEHPVFVDRSGNGVLGARDPELDVMATGADRLLAIALSALREACVPLSTASVSESIPLIVAFAEPRPGLDDADVVRVCQAVRQVKGVSVALEPVTPIRLGHAAGLAAFEVAEGYFAKKREFCVVGGVDSYFHPDTIAWLDDNRQLVGSSRSGFPLGEAAGFCLLASDAACDRFGLTPLARVCSVSTGEERQTIKTETVCVGLGLTSIVRAALDQARPSHPVSDVVCDINGERYRGEEWGFVCLRLSDRFTDPTAYRSPAESWGDVGAASGPLFAMLACHAAIGKYARGSRALLWASSESGLRAAVVLDTLNLPSS